MELSEYTIHKIAPHIINYGTGKDLVNLFNHYGFKDLYSYDNGGLPDIGKKNGQRPSKKEYVINRLNQVSAKKDGSLLDLLNIVINTSPNIIENIKEFLIDEGYTIEETNGRYSIQGAIIIKSKPVVNEAHFQDIQNRILKALDDAKVSITVVMAWFTNETIFQKLIEKSKQGVDVKLAIFDDGINRKHGVDVSQLPHVKLKRGLRGGLMHNKFCVIDNQIVITGSYNWSDNAEFKNDENITIEHDTEQATKYSVEYKRLTSS
ncbi:phosphatidylserine synthase [Elizabethkingia anophelis]|nr:phosphatidylserine synthase [Elizabethkingia anophelis]